MTSEFIENVKKIASDAGDAIMKVYHGSNITDQILYKQDNSPVTLADKISHEIISKGLQQLSSIYPIISEEGTQFAYAKRQSWYRFWLVDPLDGTREFIKKNGEFTVNIALIENNKPILGIINVPAQESIFVGHNNTAYKESQNKKTFLKFKDNTSSLIAIRSRSHASKEETLFYKKYKIQNFIEVGSALKFCIIAEGKANLYYRYGPTMEWDTAAGQALVEAAGGRVFQGLTKIPFIYNKRSLKNGSFLCVNNPAINFN